MIFFLVSLGIFGQFLVLLDMGPVLSYEFLFREQFLGLLVTIFIAVGQRPRAAHPNSLNFLVRVTVSKAYF